MIINGYCPIDITIIDPLGRTINKTSSSIPNARYREEDLNGDGEIDDHIRFLDIPYGDYKIVVYKEIWAEPTDTFSIEIIHNALSFFIVTDQVVSDILDEPYVLELNPPDKPSTPSGPSTGKINEEYTYETSTTVPEGHQIYYIWDWDDGNFSGWLGPFDPGTICEAGHSWLEKGNYEIRVKARDDHGAESEWSDPLSVSMPKSKPHDDSPFQGFLQNILERFPLLEKLLKPVFNRLLNVQ